MKPLTKSLYKKCVLFACIFIFILSSCRKEIISKEQQQELVSVANNGKNENKIYVFNIDQLYAAVNNPANTGSIVVLAPGTYILNASYPNAGRLELLENMELQGQPGQPEVVIIDASALPGTSFMSPNNFPAGRTGAIRMGRGFNSIEWITVKGNSSDQALSVIDTDLIWQDGPSNIRVAHSIIAGGRIGIDIRNVGAASVGRVLEAEIVDNEVMENLVQFGQGIEVQNANGATGAIIRATLNGNYVHGNKIGMRTFNNNANNNTNSRSITIQSNADRFEENGIGIYLAASLNQGLTTTGNGNLLHFEAHGTSIQNNQGTLPPDVTEPSRGGIYAVGGFSTNGGVASDNRLEINLWGCLMSGNYGPDIKAYGALSNSATIAGTNNVVNIHLHGVSTNATVNATSSLPGEPAGTNTVNIFR